MERSTNLGYRILHFPLTKILIGLIVISIALSAIQILSVYFTDAFTLKDKQWEIYDFIQSIISATVVLLSYKYLYQYYERRQITELSTKNLAKNLQWGFLVGFGIMSLTIFVMFITGNYKITKFNSFDILLSPLTMAISSGIIEEVLFRGVLFRIVEEKLGSYISIVISGLLFGFMHISNPNSSTFAAVAIAIEAGVLLAAAYMLTRTLWFPIAIHFIWNFSQSAIYGANVSGTSSTKSFVKAEFSGSDLITGGDFGPEASIQAMIFGLAVAIYLLYRCHKNNLIISPFWIKRASLKE